MKDLLDHGLLYGDCLTVTGKTISENVKLINSKQNQEIDAKVLRIVLFTSSGRAGSVSN